MNKIILLEVGSYKTNCYLIIDDHSKKTLIIDPGEDAQFIISEILRKDLKPVGITATHGHFDHILASFELQNTFNLPLYINKKDYFLISSMRIRAQHYLKAGLFMSPENLKFIKDKEYLKFGNISIKVIYTPGHTPGSTSFYLKDLKAIFSGDLIFKNNLLGSIDHNYSSKKNSFKSIQKIKNIGKNIIIYPGHGECFNSGSLISPIE